MHRRDASKDGLDGNAKEGKLGKAGLDVDGLNEVEGYPHGEGDDGTVA